MKLNILQVWDYIYFEVLKDISKDKAIKLSDEMFSYFYSKPDDKQKFSFTIGKIMKKYGIKRDIRPYFTEVYRDFLRA